LTFTTSNVSHQGRSEGPSFFSSGLSSSSSSQDGFVDDNSLRAATDEAKSLAKVTKPVHTADVVDYSILHAALKR
jgi:hypothetical protein